MDASSGTSDKLKVFISYSRADLAKATELKIGLEHNGFEVLLDQHGISAGEDWQARLGELILSCDTVVFVLTDTSAASKICAWEVEHASALSKRILVVTIGPLSPGATPPPDLAGINWISCWPNPDVTGSSFMQGLVTLDAALRTDLGWLRQKTEFQEDALKWESRGAEADSPFLLQGELLADAQAFIRATPKNEETPEVIARFIRASEQAETNRQAQAQAGLKEREDALARARRASNRVRMVSLIGAAVAGLFFVSALSLGLLAVNGMADVERQSSNLIAREAKAIFNSEEIDHTTSILMALQADPTASRNRLRYQFDGKTGYQYARARLRAGVSNNRLRRVFTGHEGPVVSLALTGDGRMVTGSWDRTARLWDLETGEELRAFIGHGALVTSAALTGDGRLLTVSGDLGSDDDNTARLWDIDTGEELRVFNGHGGPIYSVALTGNGRLVTGSQDMTARLWDMETGEELRQFTGHRGPIFSVALTSDGRLVTGSWDSTARLWDLETGEEIRAFTGHSGPIYSVALIGESLLVTGSTDSTARLWDLESGEAISGVLGYGSTINSVAPTSDGRLVTGSGDSMPNGDNTARLWDLPAIVLEPDRRQQIRMACEMLNTINAPLWFTRADMDLYPVLEGEPRVDHDDPNSDLISPCRCFLPDDVFEHPANKCPEGLPG